MVFGRKEKLSLVCLASTLLALGTLVVTNSAHADTVNYNVTVRSSLTLTLPSSGIHLNLDPSSNTFDSGSFNVGVATNNETGYTLILSTPNDNTDLNRTSASQDDTINAVIETLPAGTYTDSTFVANKWGYKITANTSKPALVNQNWVPFVSGITLMESSESVNGDTASLSFGSKIDYDQPYGTYNTTLNFALTANPAIQYIQDITLASCPDETKQPLLVVDRRDNEEYYIQKLADGNCWMLDNLRLDPTQVSLNDLKGESGEPNTNATDQILTYLKNGGGSSPYATSGVSDAWTSSSQNSFDKPYINATNKNTINSDPSLNWGNGSHKYGVYYNYCAASAGSYCYAEGTGTGNAQYDICPAGWKMPSGDTVNGSYYYLYNTGYSASVSNFETALSTPLSGNFFNGSIYVQGTNGSFWSSTDYGNGYYMNNLLISTSSVNPQYYNGRRNGYTVRCILQ